MPLGAAFYHQNWANQEIDTTLENGDTVSANGTSAYHGVNMYLDDGQPSTCTCLPTPNWKPRSTRTV